MKISQLDLNKLEQVGSKNFAGKKPGDLVSASLPFFYFVAGGLVLYYLVMGGYQLMFSAGDPQKTAAGKQKITYAIIGFVIVFASYWIVQIVGLALGLKTFNQIF